VQIPSTAPIPRGIRGISQAVCVQDCGIFETGKTCTPGAALVNSCLARRPFPARNPVQNRALWLRGPCIGTWRPPGSGSRPPLASPGPTYLHSPERSLNSTEIDGLQRRIRALAAENARLKASVEVGTERRKEAETALADSEERYRTLFNSIDEGFCIIE